MVATGTNKVCLVKLSSYELSFVTDRRSDRQTARSEYSTQPAQCEIRRRFHRDGFNLSAS